MSTDRELMELAAKAAGIRFYVGIDGLTYLEGCVTIWSPLTNSGDALNLAVKLGISITPYPIYNSEARHSVIAKQRRRSDTLREANPTEVLELYGDDPCAAWRLAIVRAAAEIGRAM